MIQVILGKGLILIHAGTTIRPISRQRSALRRATGKILSQLDKCAMNHTNVISNTIALVDFLVNCSSFDPRDADVVSKFNQYKSVVFTARFF
jgi:hypothetical protein